MKTYLTNLGITLTQALNALIGGWPDESLSSRAHRLRVKGHRYWGWTAGAIDALFFWQRDPGHCLGAYQSEQLRRHLPPEMREGE